MAVDWIVPKGKTQAEIDTEEVARLAELERMEAREFLADTQDDVLAVIEEHLHGLGIIDIRLHYNERRAAREKLREVTR